MICRDCGLEDGIDHHVKELARLAKEQQRLFKQARKHPEMEFESEDEDIASDYDRAVRKIHVRMQRVLTCILTPA